MSRTCLLVLYTSACILRCILHVSSVSVRCAPACVFVLFGRGALSGWKLDDESCLSCQSQSFSSDLFSSAQQSTARQSKAQLSTAQQRKARQSKAQQSPAQQRKARQSKAKHTKAKPSSAQHSSAQLCFVPCDLTLNSIWPCRVSEVRT